MESLAPDADKRNLIDQFTQPAENSVDHQLEQLNILGNHMAFLDRRVLQESCLALSELGLHSAALALGHFLGEVQAEDDAAREHADTPDG